MPTTCCPGTGRRLHTVDMDLDALQVPSQHSPGLTGCRQTLMATSPWSTAASSQCRGPHPLRQADPGSPTTDTATGHQDRLPARPGSQDLPPAHRLVPPRGDDVGNLEALTGVLRHGVPAAMVRPCSYRAAACRRIRMADGNLCR